MTATETQPDGLPAATPRAGRAPVAAPAAGYVGTLIAMLMLGAGVVALRDAAVFAGWLDGRPWTSTLIDGVDGLTVRWWTSPVGLIAVVVGVWWLYVALRPRRPTALAISARTSVWIPPADLARIASAAAETVPGVLDARTTCGLRKISVTAQITSDSAADTHGTQIKDAVAAAVGDSLKGLLHAPPKVSVRTYTGGR